MSTAAIVPHADAMVHVEDRGYQFADGVYEVCEVRAGAWSTSGATSARLQRSLGELRIALPMSRRGARRRACARRSRRNRVRNGIVYLQVTRGVARRDHAFPPPDTGAEPGGDRAQHRLAGNEKARRGRHRRHHRARTTAGGGSTSRPSALLPNVLAKQAAREQGAQEAWFVDREGYVTEGSSTNAWIVTADGQGRHPAGRPAASCAASPARS